MLSSEITKKIEDFVYSQPRSVQEIATNLNKSWRTIDRYVEEIEKNFGTLSTKVFRGGTRGALKIVYWNSVEKASSNIFQEMLEKEILRKKTRREFSPFDIFQHVADNKKVAWIKKGKNENDAGRLTEFKDILMQSKKQILFFSGGLNFSNLEDSKVNIFEILEDLVKKGIRMKIICRVDLDSMKNVERLLNLNFKYGKEMIEIRHQYNPLRVTIIDDKLINLKEEKGNDDKIKTFIFYTIKDKEWITWITKIFWKLFNASIKAEKRMYELDKIKISS
jgi:hypothetical protein